MRGRVAVTIVPTPTLVVPSRQVVPVALTLLLSQRHLRIDLAFLHCIMKLALVLLLLDPPILFEFLSLWTTRHKKEHAPRDENKCPKRHMV